MADSTASPKHCRRRWSRTAGWLLLLITLGCNSDQRSAIKGIPPPSGFAGDWMMMESAPQGSCVLYTMFCCCPHPIRAEGRPGGLLITMPAKPLMGSVSGDVVTFSDETTWPGATCSVTYAKSWTGVLESDDRVRGEWTLTLTGTGNCDPSLPCEDRGTFDWSRCPDGGCESVLCPN